jgi:hypothetical protein
MGCHDLDDGTPDHPLLASRDPGLEGRLTGERRPSPRCGTYFCRLRRQTSPLLPPKGVDCGLHAFSPANWALPGGHDGGHDAHRRPPAGTPSRLAAPSRWWAKATPPLWEYFSRVLTAGRCVCARAGNDPHCPRCGSTWLLRAEQGRAGVGAQRTLMIVPSAVLPANRHLSGAPSGAPKWGSSDSPFLAPSCRAVRRRRASSPPPDHRCLSYLPNGRELRRDFGGVRRQACGGRGITDTFAART